MANSTGVPSVVDAAIMDCDVYDVHVTSTSDGRDFGAFLDSGTAIGQDQLKKDGWSLNCAVVDSKTGDFEAVYKNTNGSFFVADRGTTFTSKDLVADALIAVGVDPTGRVN